MYGNRIREMRKKRGLTLKEVAEATGIYDRTYLTN